MNAATVSQYPSSGNQGKEMFYLSLERKFKIKDIKTVGHDNWSLSDDAMSCLAYSSNHDRRDPPSLHETTFNKLLLGMNFILLDKPHSFIGIKISKRKALLFRDIGGEKSSYTKQVKLKKQAVIPLKSSTVLHLQAFDQVSLEKALKKVAKGKEKGKK